MSRATRRSIRLAGAFAAAALHLCAGAELAFGQTAGGDEKPRATHLFNHGMRAVHEQRFEAALRLFRASYGLVSGSNTLWNIVGAEMELDMDVAAHRDLTAYLGLFRKLSPDRLKVAAEKRDELEAKLARVTVVVDPPGSSVLVDGRKDDSDGWCDPGEHLIRATAPGRAAAEKRISLKAGERQTVRLDLARLAGPPPRPKASSQRRVGLALIGTGLGGLAAGAVLGGLAFDRKMQMNQHCPPEKPTCPPGEATAYYGLQNEAMGFAFGSNLAFVLGATVTGIGTFVTLAPPRFLPSRVAAPTFSPAVSLVPAPGGAAVFLGGAW